MPDSNQPAELAISEGDQNLTHVNIFQNNQLPKFNLDDAFSTAQDDLDGTSFEFDANSFLEQMRARATLGAQERDHNDNHSEAIHDMSGEIVGLSSHSGSAGASVSTLDTYASNEAQSHVVHQTSPKTVSSSQSMKSESEGPPSTPPEVIVSHDDSQLEAEGPPSTLPEVIAPHDTQLEEAVLGGNENSADVLYPHEIYPEEESRSAKVVQDVSPGSQQLSKAISNSSSGLEKSAISSITENPEHRSTSPGDIVQTPAPQPLADSPGHHPTPSQSSPVKRRFSGPSAFQKVVSKTRPPYLPPKQKDEDDKHSREWDDMMQKSRLANQKRREELQARRLAREHSIEANTSLWEGTVLPDWKKAVADPNLRKLWWEGVPTKLRNIMWERAVGNDLALSKDAYFSALARAKNLIAAHRFPSTALSLMEADIDSTLPQLHIFNRLTGPLFEDLHDLLCAWIVSRAEQSLGYVEGVAKIGAMLLLNLTGPPQAFVVMQNLLERGCLRAFYGGMSLKDDVEAYYRIFDTLLADGMPKVYFNFKQHQISPSEYLRSWILPLFLDHLPLEACSRIWDVLLLEGDSFLFRAALALLSSMESRLFFPDRKELLDVLKGESRAALEVAKRDASTILFSPTGEVVGPKYEIYGVNEETVWERLTEMTEWWKDSRWQRLIERELPDL